MNKNSTTLLPIMRSNWIKSSSINSNWIKSNWIKSNWRWIALILCSAFISACDPGTEKQQGAKPSADQDVINTQFNTITKDEAEALSQRYWQNATRQLEKTRDLIDSLNANIVALLAAPDEDTLKAAQIAWQDTFSAYQTLAPYFYLQHPALNESLAQWPLTLAATPLQPGYLDSYDIYTQSGLVNDISLSINTASLRKQHQLTDDEEVTLGLYAIEYLLWGDKENRSSELFQQQYRVPLAFAQAGLKINELPQNRRRQLLRLQSELLLNDITLLVDQFQEGGLLQQLYFQLDPVERLTAQHNGLKAHLSDTKAPQENQETINPENRFEKRSIELAQLATRIQIKTINEIYFSTTRIEGTKKDLSLADSFLNTEEKDKVETLLNSVNNK